VAAWQQQQQAAVGVGWPLQLPLLPLGWGLLVLVLWLV
jgi:hypothetical protein